MYYVILNITSKQLIAKYFDFFTQINLSKILTMQLEIGENVKVRIEYLYRSDPPLDGTVGLLGATPKISPSSCPLWE